VEPILLRGVKRDLLRDAALAEVRRIVADHQREKLGTSTTERELADVEASIERVTEAIAEAGISRALREKLGYLERRRDELEAKARASSVTRIDLLPRVVDQWLDVVENMEDIALRPGARPEDVEEARERLSAILGKVRLVPEDGHLVAEVGLEALRIEPSIRMVAGARFRNFLPSSEEANVCLLELPKT
jgi:predicted nucleic acid-binding protein